MTNNEKLEILEELKRGIHKAKISCLEDALEALQRILRVLDKIFPEEKELRELALDYLVGKISLKDMEDAISS